MRTVITVVGVGQRRQGTAKGRTYDFTPVSVNYVDNYTTGMAATTLNVTQDLKPDQLEIGESYEVFMHQQNFRQVLDGIIGRVDNG